MKDPNKTSIPADELECKWGVIEMLLLIARLLGFEDKKTGPTDVPGPN